MEETLSGKSVIVTGAASGIGRAIADQCAQAGAHVLLTDIVDSVHATASEIGRGAESMIVDVSDRDQIAAAIDQVVEEHGSLDFIFNNAGVAIFGEVEIVTLDDWDKIIDVNLKGVAYGVKLAYDQMVKQGSGHIINTASAAGLVPVPLQTHYVTTKHAVVGMAKALELEAEDHNIHVTTFCPGFIETGMMTNNTLRGTMDVPDVKALVPVPALSADKAAARLLAGVAKQKRLVITPFYVRVGWWLERLSPSLAHAQHRFLYKQTVKRAKKEQRRAVKPKDQEPPKIPA
jgi:NAD(P)-dependent dehydrogenase (short-subunit alcohol dehydrogenase family)